MLSSKTQKVMYGNCKTVALKLKTARTIHTYLAKTNAKADVKNRLE